MEKENLYGLIKDKKAFIYKIEGKYYIISNKIFEECLDNEIINEYESIYNEIEEWENMCEKEIRNERLKRSELERFVPSFDKVRKYCDENEDKHNSNSGYVIPDDTNIKQEVMEKLMSFINNLSQQEIKDIENQVRDMVWLCGQSINFEIINYSERSVRKNGKNSL